MERALAALVAVWFVFATIEPAVLHSCPTHGSPHGAAHAGAAAADDHGSHGAATAATADAPADAPTSAHQCTCLGDCAGVALSALPARAHTPWPTSVAAVSALPPLEAGFTPPAPDFARPFANGPPPG